MLKTDGAFKHLTVKKKIVNKKKLGFYLFQKIIKPKNSNQNKQYNRLLQKRSKI